jgi:hypothetical protein
MTASVVTSSSSAPTTTASGSLAEIPLEGQILSRGGEVRGRFLKQNSVPELE